MAQFHRQDLAKLGSFVQTPLPPMNGLQLMRRGPVEALVRAQDYVPAMSRRIVASGGLDGLDWTTPDTDPTAMAGTHPGPDERRRIGAGAVDLTPGCFLEAWVVCVPCGETQITGTTPGGATGQFEVQATWTDTAGVSVSTVHNVFLPASVEAFGAEPSNMWDNLHELKIEGIRPPGVDETEELARWNHCTVEVELFAVGGARIVDSSVFERPFSAAFEVDTDGDTWTSHLYGPGSPQGPAQPMQYPVTRLGGTAAGQDPRGGTHHIMDVHEAQHRYLGPVLFGWNGASEQDGSEFVTITSPTFVELSGGGAVTFDLDEPGLCCGTGGYARRQSSNSTFVLRDRVAVCPVILRALASAADGVGSIRVMTRPDSYIDISVPIGGESWISIFGWLECGINPDDSLRTVPQFFGLVTAGGPSPEVTIGAITCHFAGGYVPAK